MIRKLLLMFSLTLLLLLPGGVNIGQSQPLTPQQTALVQQAHQNGVARVIVGLNTPTLSEAWMRNADQVSNQRQRIANAQLSVLGRTPGINTASVDRFRVIPYMALTVDARGLRSLFADPAVTSVVEDIVLEINLAESVPVVGAPAAWTAGYDGSGQVVAVLDSGIDTAHPFLAGKVVAEACFSYAGPLGADQVTSNCPNGAEQQIGPGAAAPCTGTGCFHGTHVAGIIAGENVEFSGVAPGASLIGVNVSSRPALCGFFSACVAVPISNVIQALEWVYEQRNTYNIVAVNMSLGSASPFSRVCDNIVPAQDAIINALYDAGIVSIAGSGNGDANGAGYLDGISLPGCLSNVVSVGATDLNDGLAGFSNSSGFLDLLAPGASINSSMPGGGYQAQPGTSFATPHVAGAWAILAQAVPNASIDQMLTALKLSGPLVNDLRNGVITPRLQVDAAVTTLQGGVPPHYDVLVNEIRGTDTEAVELYNQGDTSADLSGWQLLLYNSNNTLASTYTFPNGVSLAAGNYLTLVATSGVDSASVLYVGAFTGGWDAAGAVRLRNPVIDVDFVRWGTSTVANSIGSGWSGENPAAPGAANTLGRDANSLDLDAGSDWLLSNPTLGAVNAALLLANDNIANATTVTLPFSESINALAATLESQEMLPTCSTIAANTVWYRFNTPERVNLVIDTTASEFDTVLAVYTGTPGNLTEQACNDDAPGSTGSKLSVFTEANTDYYIQVGRYTGFAGQLTVNMEAGIENDDFDGATVIDTLPFFTNSDTTDAQASGDDPSPSCNPSAAASMWYRYTPTEALSLTASTSGSQFDTILSIYTGSRGNLTEIACSDDVSFFSADFTSIVTFEAQAGETYHFMISGGAAGDRGPLTFQITEADEEIPTNTPVPTMTPIPTSTPIPTNTPVPTETAISDALTLSAPTGTLTDFTGAPVYQWPHQVGATAYGLYVHRSADPADMVLYEAALSAATYCTDSLCSVDAVEISPTYWLANGNYTAWLIANPGGTWVEAGSFSIQAPQPIIASNFDVADNQTLLNPSFTFDRDTNQANPTWYRLYVAESVNLAVSVIDWWFVVDDATCVEDTCTIRVPEANALQPNGTYNAYLHGWGPGGMSRDWAASSAFTIAPADINADTMQAAVASSADTTLSWEAAAGNEWYQVWVGNFPPVVVGYTGWHSAAEMGCNPTCTLQIPDVLASAEYRWYVSGWGQTGFTQGGLNGWVEGEAFNVP